MIYIILSTKQKVQKIQKIKYWSHANRNRSRNELRYVKIDLNEYDMIVEDMQNEFAKYLLIRIGYNRVSNNVIINIGMEERKKIFKRK